MRHEKKPNCSPKLARMPNCGSPVHPLIGSEDVDYSNVVAGNGGRLGAKTAGELGEKPRSSSRAKTEQQPMPPHSWRSRPSSQPSLLVLVLDFSGIRIQGSGERPVRPRTRYCLFQKWTLA
eukprot:COSAG02_NODE_4950_length_4796_cov_7.041729_5_plen_121_part_00